MVKTARISPDKSTAPTMAWSISPCCNERTAAFKACKPEFSSLEKVIPVPPILNSRAIRLATIPPRAPTVRFAVRGGQKASRSDSIQAVNSSSSNPRFRVFAQYLAFSGIRQRYEKFVLLKSSPIPIYTPARKAFSSSNVHPASSNAIAATCSINNCWGSDSWSSLGGILKRPKGTKRASRKYPLNTLALKPL